MIVQAMNMERRRGEIRLVLLVVMAAIVITAVIFFFGWSKEVTVSRDPAAQAVPVPAADDLEAAQTSGQSQEQAQAAPRSAVPVRRPAATTAPPAPVAPVTNPAADQAIARLSALEADKPLTVEQAASAKQDLQRLVAEGTNSIASIRQFLQLNKDVSLDEVKGGSPVGYNSLRAGMFDALHQIGGPESVAALTDVLGATADPAEVALLARHLEEMAPGEHRDEILTAARETLTQAAQSKGKADVAPLFQILQNYGGSSAVADLQRATPQWKYYGLMALAGLPEGQGVPALIEQAQKTGPAGQAPDVFAIQMLAQVAPQFPEASAALVDQAKAGQIPERAWRRIADALAGDQYQFSKDAGVDTSSLMRTPGVKTYHIAAGNENFYSVPLGSGNGSPGDLGQRRALIDQLLGATSNPAAVTALQQARAQLDK